MLCHYKKKKKKKLKYELFHSDFFLLMRLNPQKTAHLAFIEKIFNGKTIFFVQCVANADVSKPIGKDAMFFSKFTLKSF